MNYTAAFDAMTFARRVHAGQARKYTGNPYADHLAEVAGIAMSVGWRDPAIHPDNFMAVCWLHDCIEDQGVTFDTLAQKFGHKVASGVLALSDLETEGNRAARKAASRERLAAAPWWIQNIKVADLISNTASIVRYDPTFAGVYLDEKGQLLPVLHNASDPRAVMLAQRVHARGVQVLQQAQAFPGNRPTPR